MNIFRELRGVLYQLYKISYRSMPKPAGGITLDVVIPVLEKDLRVLPLCLEGVRRCVNHSLGKIYLVSPESERVFAFCAKNDLIFVEESSVLGYSPRDVRFVTSSGRDRSGWLFQQLIKLSGALGDNPYYLVIDADHVLLHPHTFFTEDHRYLFYRSNERHLPYYQNIRRLLGEDATRRPVLFSYVTHKMFFDKARLAALRALIEKKSGKRWDRAIMDSLDRTQLSPFSEFELYGQYISSADKINRPWRTKSMTYDFLDSYENLYKRYGKRYWAVTFPDYYNKK